MVKVRRSVKQKVVAAAAVAALLAGGVDRRRVGDRPEQPAQARSAPIATRAGAHARDLATAAGYLGVSPAQLTGELRSGKTLAQIADATQRQVRRRADRSARRGAQGATGHAGRQAAHSASPPRSTAPAARAVAAQRPRLRRRARASPRCSPRPRAPARWPPSYLGVTPVAAEGRAELGQRRSRRSPTPRPASRRRA